jgi:hypothetical protein
MCCETLPDVFPATWSSISAVVFDDIHAAILSMAERPTSRVLAVVARSNVAVVGAALIASVNQDRGSVDELHVITSGASGAKLRTDLLRSPSGTEPVSEWCDYLGIARGDILFGSRTIHVLPEATGPVDAGEIADEMLETLRILSAPSNILSIAAAGDAGPLAILAHAALALVGRPHDQFFFIDLTRGSSATRPDSPRTHKEPPRAVLTPIPIVFAPAPAADDVSFQRLAESRRIARQRLADPADMVLDVRDRTVRIGATSIALPRLQFFWLFVIATLAPAAFPLKALSGNFQLDGHGRIVVTAGASDRQPVDAALAAAKKAFVTLFPSASEEFPRVLKHACGISPGLPSIVAKINSRLKQDLGIGATPYLIAGGRSAEGYRLMLPAARIRTTHSSHAHART